MTSPVYYINGKQQYNSDISFNNANTQIASSQSVLINSPSIEITGYTTINGSAPITLNTDNTWTGKNYFPLDLSVNNLFISSTASTSTLTDRIVSIDASNKVIYVDLSASSSNSVALGGHSLMNNKSAWGSTAIGYDAMKNISNRTDVSYANTAVGTRAMAGEDSPFGFIGWNNTAIGNNALSNISMGGSNVAIGSQTLKTNTTGAYNTVVGCSSDVILNSTCFNQILGYNNTSGFNNVNIIGTGINATGANKTFINNVNNSTGVTCKNIAIYDPSSSEVSYCSDMIQKSLESTQFISQQALKLIAIDSLGSSNQGTSMAITSDGNTLAIGGSYDNGGIGAVWIWTKSGNTWTRQQKLVCTGYSGSLDINQGCSIAFSTNDGNTIAIGGSGDNNGIGAVWIWNRQSSGEPYNQQQKIIGTGALGQSAMGTSVALSGDGNTLVFGGPADNSNKGAVWIWTRSGLGQTYSQYQTPKITGSDSTTVSLFGKSVVISNDGTTIAVGGSADNNNTGAVFILKKVVSSWTQQGSKLIGTSTSQTPMVQGTSLAISSDGNTLAVGGSGDNDGIGAVWVWTRSGSAWSQVGNKLVGTNYINSNYQGSSISMTGDGNTIVVGGPNDNVGNGAAWIWSRSAFGQLYYQQGQKIVGAGNISVGGFNSKQGSSVIISNDGSSLFVGGSNDNNSIGAVWFYPKTTNNIYVGNNNTSLTIGSTTPTSQLISQIIQSIKITALDNCGNSQQGYSIAMTSDGNTMAIGSPGDNNNRGAVWIWHATGQPLIKIVGPAGSYFGSSVAFSGSLDSGNTLAIGGFGDNGNTGAVWVYTRSVYMSSYILQGSKMVPSSLTGTNNQVGFSISLSSNGNRLAVGAPGDNDNNGSTWIWDRSGSVWTQQALKLYVAPLGPKPTKLGTSVAFSGDGNTLVIGGIGYNDESGAVWVFTWSVSESAWSSIKISDDTTVLASYQGDSVSISTDGNTIVYGSPGDNYGIGSSTVWTRSGTYSFIKLQKISGTNSVGLSNQGSSVALSGDGLTLMVGGNYDNDNIGATWVWTRDTATNKFYQFGPKIVGTGNIGNSQQGYSVATSSDGSKMSVGGYSDIPSSGSLGIGAVWMFNKNSSSISVSSNNQFMGIGTVTPTAPLTISCNNSNQGIATGSSCLDIYNYDIGGAFQRYFSNNQSNAWWHVGSEVGDGGKNFPYHIFNQTGTGVYVNSGDQSWSGYSDRRLKTNIVDIDISGAYQSLLKLNPVTYKLLTDTNSNQVKQGLIAQDVLSVFPQIVNMNHGYYGIGYTELIPYLIAGMKQQAVIISQQGEENAVLKKEINENKKSFEERLEALEAKIATL
jgi:hypothetical protein